MNFKKKFSHDLKSNLIFTFIYRFIVFLSPLITSPYISRILGPNQIGLYSYTNAFTLFFVSLSMLGIHDYGSRRIAQSIDNRIELSINFWSIYFLQIFLTLFFSIIYLILVFFIFNDNFIVRLILTISILSNFLELNWFANGLSKFRYISIRNIVIRVSMIVSIFIFIKGPDDLLTYIIIIITFNLISLFSIIPLIFKYTFFLVPKIETIKYHFFQNTYLFLPILTTIFISQFSKILLDLYSLRSEVGFYQIAENISLLPTFFNTAIVTVMFPYSSKLVYGNNPERNHEVLQISIKFSSIINIGIVFGLISLSKEFIPWYLGENYQRTAVIIQYLAPFIIISGIVNIIIYQYLLPHSMDKLYTTIFLFAAFLNLILNYLFIPIYQGIGVAISLNFTYLIILILFIFIPSKNSINKSLFLNLVPFLFSGILMYFSINLLKFLNFSALLNLIIKGLFGLLIYTFLSSFFLIWQKDFVFKQIINKFIGRKI